MQHHHPHAVIAECHCSRCKPFERPCGCSGCAALTPSEPPSGGKDCACKLSDAWRCAVDRSLTSVSCACGCHRLKEPSPAEQGAREEPKQGDEICMNVYWSAHYRMWRCETDGVQAWGKTERECLIDWADKKFPLAAGRAGVGEDDRTFKQREAAYRPTNWRERAEALQAFVTPPVDASCTCPSGDGSMRWPCPKHPPTSIAEIIADWPADEAPLAAGRVGVAVDDAMVERAPYAPPQEPSAQGREADALAAFTEYFVKNYPGPDTIISDPRWHAPRIFRAAQFALATPPVDASAPDPTFCTFYEVEGWPALVAAMEHHILKLQEAARRNIKPWEDTFPPKLLPKFLRDCALDATLDRPARVAGRDFMAGESVQRVIGRAHAHYDVAHGIRPQVAPEGYDAEIADMPIAAGRVGVGEARELIGQLVSVAACFDAHTARSLAERIDAKLATPPAGAGEAVVPAAVCRALVNLVEGQPIRWAGDGVRLKDTPEWVAFYLATNREAVVDEPVAGLLSSPPTGWVRNTDGEWEFHLGERCPANRSGGFSTPWAAVYDTPAVRELLRAAPTPLPEAVRELVLPRKVYPQGENGPAYYVARDVDAAIHAISGKDE